MTATDSLHVHSREHNFEEFRDLCKRLKLAKTRVVVLTERMRGETFSHQISLGTISSVYPHADENVVLIAVTGRTWIDGRYRESMSGAPYIVFSGVTAEHRSMHTTFYEDANEMRSFLEENGIYVADRELGL